MPTKWDFEAALEEVADAINEGSVKLDMDGNTRKMVKDLYREDFKALAEAVWKTNRTKVLEMAGKAGCCAEMATIVLWVNGIGIVSEHMDPETVLLVCVMVSKLHCSLLKGPVCPNVDYTQPKGKKLNEILKTIGALA